MRAFRGFCVGMVLGIVGVLVVTDARLQYYQNIAEEAPKQAAARVSITQAAYADSLLNLRRDTVRLTRWATRYDTIRDTLDALLITDTVTTVPADWVRQLITVSDSTVAACRDLVSSARGALTACDSVQSALRVESDAWRKAYQTVKPSKWDRIKPYAFGALGFYVGAKLRVK